MLTVRLTGADAIVAAEMFEGVTLHLEREPIAPAAARAFLVRESLVPSDLDLWANVTTEIYRRVRCTPLHVHQGPLAPVRSRYVPGRRLPGQSGRSR